MKELIFATHNQNKLAEIQNLLGNDFRVKSLTDIGILEEIPETKNTFQGNAYQKANYIYTRQKVNVFSDDSGLVVYALNGEPGVFSARYAGNQKDNQSNMALVLKNLSSSSDRSAHFTTVISLIWEDKPYTFEGVVKGQITKSLYGDKGFGYDPLFIPNGFDLTFAQMTKDQKNAISHRGIAVRKMINFIKEQS